MMCILSYELERGAKAMYPDATEARVRLQKYVTKKYTETITYYPAWHQFTNIEYHEDVKELLFPWLSDS